jgi:hypothetical protein
LAVIFLLATFAACKKAPEEAMEKRKPEPLFAGGFGTGPSSIDLSYQFPKRV